MHHLLEDYDYSLPRELIAQEPAAPRDSSRLMVVRGEKIEHRLFRDLPEYFNGGDVLVLNDTRVIPARLRGRKASGGAVEVLLVEEKEQSTWRCLIKGKNIRDGTLLIFNGMKGTVTEKIDGAFIVKFDSDSVIDAIEKIGMPPVPPYIKRHASMEQYQTVYASKPGSIAAPTAGLHFTDELLHALEKMGVKIARVTLHIGLGTFMPVKTSDITKHKMEKEFFEVSQQTADTINNARSNGCRIFAAGTTTLKTLESASNPSGVIEPRRGASNLFIYPPYEFKSQVDALITNFHLPRSTLLMLVCAFAGRERIFKAYEEAIAQRYRFYSFGDAMLIFKNYKRKS